MCLCVCEREKESERARKKEKKRESERKGENETYSPRRNLTVITTMMDTAASYVVIRGYSIKTILSQLVFF